MKVALTETMLPRRDTTCKCRDDIKKEKPLRFAGMIRHLSSSLASIASFKIFGSELQPSLVRTSSHDALLSGSAAHAPPISFFCCFVRCQESGDSDFDPKRNRSGITRSRFSFPL